MPNSAALELLKRELGPAAAQLPDLSGVPGPALETFATSVRRARQEQKRLLEHSAEQSLRLVPALLRPVVRKVLFG